MSDKFFYCPEVLYIKKSLSMMISNIAKDSFNFKNRLDKPH